MSRNDVRFEYDMEFAEFLHYPEQVQRDIMNFRMKHNEMEYRLLKSRRGRIHRMMREEYGRYPRPRDSIRVQVQVPTEDLNAQIREMKEKTRKESRAIISGFLRNPSSYSISVDKLRVFSGRATNSDVRLSEYIDWIYDLRRTRKIHKSIRDNVSYFLSFHENAN